MLGTFHPSKIEDKIYEIIEDYEVKIDVYSYEVINLILNYFDSINLTEFQLACNNRWTDGVCSIAWMEDGFSHLVVFDYEEQ